MENIKLQIRDWFLSKKLFIWLYSIILIFIGLIYILIEYHLLGQIKDSLFIGLLFGGSFILLIGIKWIQSYFLEKIEDFYNGLDEQLRPNRSNFRFLTKKIFKNPLVLVSGTMYIYAFPAQ
jgi:hypothetical protein